MSKIEVKRIAKFLEENDYKKHEIKIVLKKIKNMDTDILTAFISWFEDGQVEDIEVEGISIDDLLQKMNFSYINAFLYLDWLKRDPAEAKIALAGVVDNVRISEDVREELSRMFGNQTNETDELMSNDTYEIMNSEGGLNG